MAKAFNLTAELNLRGPGNLKQVAAAIRREIGSIDANVKLKIDRAAERSILGNATALGRLNRELEITATASARTTNNITGLVAALNGLSNALGGSNNSMERIVSSAEQTSRQLARVRKNTVEAKDEMEEFGRQSALAVRRFAAFNAATSVIYGLYNAVSKATSEFIEFDRQLVRLTQITGESYNELNRITDTITGLSTGLGVASSDLIRISDTLAQAGLSARETDQALRALALTALAPSFDDLNNTVEGSIALMRQFKISTEDLDNALGSINAVAAGFAVEASDIITAIQRTGGVFAAASKGVSEGTDALNEFIAVFTSVRATTRESAETIATGLRTIFTRIQREDTIEALKEYGVNLLDVQGKFVGAYKAVQLLSEGLGKLDPRDVSFSRIVEELGGFRQIGKVLPLIQEFGTAQQALTVAQRGQNSLAADAIKAQASLAVQFSKTRESFVALIREIGKSDSFQTLVSLGLTLANTFIKVADVARPLLPILATIGAIKGAKALTSFVGGFVGGLQKVKPGDQGGGAASSARNNRAAADVTDNSRYLDANTTALNNLGSTMGALAGAITPLQASIDNLGNSAIAQLTNEVVALNNTIASTDFGGGGGTVTANSGGRILKFAKGGSVPGSGRGDRVPSMLEPGEFVVNRKAVQAYGKGNLVAINKGQAKKFAAGGLTEYFTIDELLGRSGSNTINSVLFPASNIEKSANDRLADKAAIRINRRTVKLTEKEDFQKIWDTANASASMGGGKYKSYEGVDVSPENRDRLRQIRQSDRRRKAPPATGESSVGKLMSAEGRWGKAYEEVLAAKLSGKWESASNQSDYPIDLVRKLKDNSIDAIGEAKFRSIPTDDMDLVSKLLRYRIDKKSIGSYFKEQSSGSSIDEAMLGTLDYFWAEDQKKQFYQWIEKQRAAGIPGFNLGGLIQKFSIGGVAELAQQRGQSLQDTIIQELEALGKIAGVKKILGVGGGDRELDSLLRVSNLKQGRRIEEAAKVIDRALSAGNIESAAEVERISRLPKVAVAGLVDSNNALDYNKNFEWNIGTDKDPKNIYAYVRGFKGKYLNAVRQMQQETSESSIRLAENVQYADIFDGGSLVFDFDETLVSGGDILDANGKPNIPQYSNRDAVAEALKKAKLTRLGAKLKTLIDEDPNFIRQTRILTARPQATADLLAKTLQTFGLPYKESDITGVSSGASTNIAAAKAANLAQTEKLIDDSLDNLNAVSKSGKKGFLYTEPKAKPELDELMGQGNIEGAVIEKALALLGANLPPIDQLESNRAIDFPNGLGRAAQFFGLDPDLPTEIKRTLDGSAFERARNEFARYFLENPNIARFAGGGIVSLFHGSNTGTNDSVLNSFKEKGALSNIATGYGQGAGFYVYTEKDRAVTQAKMRVAGGGFGTVVSGDTTGKPMVLTFNEALTPENYDLDYELQKSLIIKWMTENFDKIQPTLSMKDDAPISLLGKVDKNLEKGIMSSGIRVQEGSQTLTGDDGQQYTVQGGARRTLYSGTDGNVREGELIGKLMQRLTAGDPALVNEFESKLFQKPYGLVLKYVGQSPLKPSNIEILGDGNNQQPARKEEKQYPRISLTSDGSTINAGYVKNDTVSGFVMAKKAKNNLYTVGLSKATGGGGPKLYDAVMEAATEQGAMLTSDRAMVSGDAKKVWEYYFKNRSDVKKVPLEPEDWTKNNALIDPKLYGRRETWPPPTDLAWVLQSGYTKSPSLINDPKSVTRANQKQDSRTMAMQFFQRQAQGLQTGGFAEGGSVPALLTPGEAVIGPKLAKKIGYGRLRRMNHADKNGMGRYAGGGDVGIVPGSGNTDSFGPVGLPVGSFVIRKKATEALGFNKGGAIGIQKFADGGELQRVETVAINAKELAQIQNRIDSIISSFPQELKDAFGVTIGSLSDASVLLDTSSWNAAMSTVKRSMSSIRKQTDSLGPDIVEAFRQMSTGVVVELDKINRSRVATQEQSIAKSEGYSSQDLQRMQEDTLTARQARLANRNAGNPVSASDAMKAAVGTSPQPISVSPPTITPPPLPPLPVRDTEYYRKRMNYSDVSGQTDTAISPSGQKYAEELTKQDNTKVDALVSQMRDMFSTAMSGIGQAPSIAGQSESWATWDIGKQLHMNENPDKSSDKYRLGNPMQDPKLVLQMVQRMVGYEVTGGGQRGGKANNIPSFELVDIGAKAMAESLGKNKAALDAFLAITSGITKDDIIGSAATSTAPTPAPSGPPTSPPSPPSPPAGGGPPGSPPAGDAEAAIQRYMMELEEAAKATKLQTYQEQRLAGATASEAKARADAAAFAAVQAAAQNRLTSATADQADAINEARSRMASVRGGAVLSSGEMRTAAQSTARGSTTVPDNTDYAKSIQDNVVAIQNMTKQSLLYSGAAAVATSALGQFVGSTTLVGSTLSSLSTSIGNTQALFYGFNKGLEFIAKAGTSEDASKTLSNFSSTLIDASRRVSTFADGMSPGFLKNIVGRIGGGLDTGGGMVGKLAGNLPKVISGITGSLSALAGPAALVVGAFNAAASAFIAITDTLRRNKLERATQILENSLKNASEALASYNQNTVENANQLKSAGMEISRAASAAKTLADISKTNPQWSTSNVIGETLALGGGSQEGRSQRADILSQKGSMAYFGSLLDVTGRTQEQYTRELAPQNAAKSSEQFAKVASMIEQQNSARFKAGETSSDIMKDPGWAQQAEVLARSNAKVEESLRLIDADLSVSRQVREARKQELIQFTASNAVRQQEVQAIRQRNSEQADRQSSSLLYGLERMLSNMEQSINSVTHSLNKLADATDLMQASMTGDAKVGAARIDALNILQNPNVSSQTDRSAAANVGSQFFGGQAANMKGLLEFGPKLEETILSTINSTIEQDPKASSGKIEARIGKNIEDELGKLNIDAALKQTLSRQVAADVTSSRTSSDDKKDFRQLFNESSALGKTIQATKRAQETAVKALEFYQESLNSYAQATNEMVNTQISSNEKFRRASDIRARGETDLAKALGKTISFTASKRDARAGVMSQAGTTDPEAIFNNIGRLEQLRQGQQASMNNASQGGPRNQKDIVAFNRELASTTMSLRENYAALKGLSESTEVAQAALNKIGELRAKNEAGLNILERYVSSSPKDQAKLSGAFDRLERNMNGQTNNMWESVRVQEAYNEALQSGASMKEAQEAADSAAAQDRSDTLEAFKMLAPMLGENQNQLKANMLESMMRESGTEMSPMFNKVLEGLRNPEGDPQMAEAINQYKQATELQAKANEHLAMLDGNLAQQIGANSQQAFQNALNGVQQASANANLKDISQGINTLNTHLQNGVTKVTNVAAGGGEAMPFARGGTVTYKAVGGSIFKPKGTDTVPAMLTPGEFVVNKEAASSNKSLLTAINNGYAKGGPVKYLAEGGWVSDMLQPEKDRFTDSKPGELYTTWNDFSKFGSGNDVIKNIAGLDADKGSLQFYKPYSYPTFNGSSADVANALGAGTIGTGSMKGNQAEMGILPDFYLSRQIVNKTLEGAGLGAAAGIAAKNAAAGRLGQVVATTAANNSGEVDGAPMGIGGNVGGWIWEAMKFVPGLGAVVSGIDAVRELFKGNILGAALEGLSAVFNLVPIPGAGVVGKGVTKALGWALKWVPGFKRLASAGGKLIPGIFQKFAPGLYDKMAGFLNGNTVDVLMRFIPNSIKKKLGMSSAKAAAEATSAATGMTARVSEKAAIRMGGETLEQGVRTAARNAVPGLAATGAVVGAGKAIYDGATPVEVKGIGQKLQELAVDSGISYPMQFRDKDTALRLIDGEGSVDHISLTEAKAQEKALKQWVDSFIKADEWKLRTDPPEAQVSTSGSGAYTTYSFGPTAMSKDKEYMYAYLSQGKEVPKDAFPKRNSAGGLLQFRTDGYPTLDENDPKKSAITEQYLAEAVKIDNSAANTNVQDFSVVKDALQSYYDSLKEVKAETTTPDNFNSAHWTRETPSKAKEGRYSKILGALQSGTRLKYDFKQSEIKDSVRSSFGWSSSAGSSDKPGEGATGKSSGNLTVYGTAMRPSWKSLVAAKDTNEAIKNAIEQKKMWDYTAENGFKIYQEGKPSNQYDPLPWSTIDIVPDDMLKSVQAQQEAAMASQIGLKVKTAATFDKLIDLPNSKFPVPVQFSYRPFEQIPLLDPATVDIDGQTKTKFLPGPPFEPSDTPMKGVHIIGRNKAEGGINPFQSMGPGAEKLLPYYSSEAAMEAAVNEWALANFNIPDWGILGMTLAGGYQPIMAEAAMQSAEYVRGARTSRKAKPGQDQAQGSDAEDSAAAYLLRQNALFYTDSFLSGLNPVYEDAKNPILAKIPNIIELVQGIVARKALTDRKTRQAQMEKEASLIHFKSEQIPMLAAPVWSKIKNINIPMGSLSSAADWAKAASNDGVAPPGSISTQDDLMAAVDYISWVKGKALQLEQEAYDKNQGEKVETLASEGALGQYMSAGRFFSQLASDAERPISEGTSIGQASTRLYTLFSKSGNLEKYLLKEKETDQRSGKELVKKFWNVPEVVRDPKFVDYILGFANQVRTAQRFKQLVTGNNLAKISSEQMALLQSNFAAFGSEKKASEFMAGKTADPDMMMMKVATATGTEDIQIPETIDDILTQFLDDSKVYEPKYRETLGNILWKNADTYARKWTQSKDPGTAGWAGLWEEYSPQLISLRDFLTDRDDLLMRPVAGEGEQLFEPAVVPSVNGLISSLTAMATQAKITPPTDVNAETFIGALKDKNAFVGLVNQFVGSVSPTAPEDFEKRDQMKATAQQVLDFYDNNLSPDALPRVFTEKGNELWNKMKMNYEPANKAFTNFSGLTVDGEGGPGMVGLQEIYDENLMPYAQPTLYGFYYNKNRKAGTTNTVEALLREKAVQEKEAQAASQPKPQTAEDVANQAAKNAPNQAEVPPSEAPRTEEETRNAVNKAKGGLIYRADGGAAPVNWSPKGTDTVPAMLTPGEFVINRDSTQRYLPILEAINNGNNTTGQIVSYASRGGVINPKYFSGGGENKGGGSSGGVSSSYSMGFDSATLTAIKQFETSVTAFGEALGGLNIGNITLDETALTALGDFTTKFTQFAETLSKLNVPPIINITGKHEVNVNINGTATFNNMEEKVKELVRGEVDRAFENMNKQSEGSFNFKPK